MKLPVIDLQFWVESDKLFKHKFYKKLVSQNTKTNTTLMVCYRRLINSSPHTPWTKIVSHISEYMNVMRISRYYPTLVPQ